MLLLEKDVFPWLGSRPVAEITAPEVLAILRLIERRGVTNPTHKAKEKHFPDNAIRHCDGTG